MSDTRRPSAVVRVVASALLLQATLMMMSLAPAVFAPVAAPAMGVGAHWVGTMYALGGLGAMISGMFGRSIIETLGPQRALAASALGMALAMLLGASAVPLLALASGLAIGLALGPMVPALMAILVERVPRERFAFMTSIQQLGPPIGVAIGGAVLPGLMLLAGWRELLVLLALVAVATALVVFSRGSGPTTAERRASRARRPAFLRPLALVAATPALGVVSLAGFVLAVIFQGQAAFLVVYLNLELGIDLVTAGFMLTGSLVGAILGRLCWGWIADRRSDSILVLGIVLLAAGATTLLLAFWPKGAPVLLLGVLAFFHGATASGWQGVFYAAAARHAPRDALVDGTAGAQFWFFAGGVAGGLGISGIVAATGGYWIGFAVIAVSSILAGAVVLFQRRGLTAVAPPARP